MLKLHVYKLTSTIIQKFVFIIVLPFLYLQVVICGQQARFDQWPRAVQTRVQTPAQSTHVFYKELAESSPVCGLNSRNNKTNSGRREWKMTGWLYSLQIAVTRPHVFLIFYPSLLLVCLVKIKNHFYDFNMSFNCLVHNKKTKIIKI